MLSLLRRFNVKAMVPMSQFTDSEKFLLARVFLDDEVAKHFRWKRYLINEDVKFEGEANIINWENYRVSKGTLREAQELAEKEKLDLVLVYEDETEPVVRIMNYRNWILRWAFRDKQIKTVAFQKKSSPYFYLSHRITENDLNLKLKKIGELLEKHHSVSIESKVTNENSLDEIRSLRKFEINIQKKIKGSIEGKAVTVKVISGELQTKVLIRKIGKMQEFGDYNLALNEPKDESRKYDEEDRVDFGNEEDEFMKEVLQGDGEKFHSAKSEVARMNSEGLVGGASVAGGGFYDDDDENFDPMREELNTIKMKISDLVGEELAEKFLKGRLKYK